MKAKATVHLKFSSEKHLEIVVKALEPEAKKPATKRSKTNIGRKNAVLTLKVETGDTVALRATLNAYLRWISTVYSVLSTAESFKLSKE
ncbi:MAG: KEOPS complex subunit Pcc1 [Candidatus Bathyarchaeia archaeon]